MQQLKYATITPLLFLFCTSIARADFVDFSNSTSRTLGELGSKFVIGCALLAAGMVGAAFLLRKK
jgi:hypothetical protein